MHIHWIHRILRAVVASFSSVGKSTPVGLQPNVFPPPPAPAGNLTRQIASLSSTRAPPAHLDSQVSSCLWHTVCVIFHGDVLYPILLLFYHNLGKFRGILQICHISFACIVIGSVTSLSVCLSVRRSVGLSVIISQKGGRLHFNASIYRSTCEERIAYLGMIPGSDPEPIMV